jgi:DNA-binding transcriptional LysR family regulator
VTPTEEGRVLYEGARGGLSTIEQAVEAVGQTRQVRARTLRLATSAAGASGPFLRPAILEAKRRDPSLVVEIEHKNTAQDRLDAVRRGRADLTVVPATDVIRGLEVRPCFDVPLGLVVHREHPFARRKQLELEELGAIRYIAQGRASGTYRHIDAALSALGIRLEVSHVAADERTSRLMVELGRGETFAPLMLREGLERGGQVKLVAVPSLPPIQMAIAVRSFALLPEAAREFLVIYERFARDFGRSPRPIKTGTKRGPSKRAQSNKGMASPGSA